jgi:protocatechuate 3,4-dioxygenase beta subunit
LDTDDNIEGPFFKPSSPERANLVDPGMAGTRMSVRGRVFGEGCGVLLAGAILDFWQADSTGAYFDDKLRGHQFAGSDGGYGLSTIIPGHYLNGSQYRPSHIHVKVQAPGYPLLTTQLYFEGDPYNDIDPFIKKSLIMKILDAGGGAKMATFDFVLKKA